MANLQVRKKILGRGIAPCPDPPRWEGTRPRCQNSLAPHPSLQNPKYTTG